jgi:hypothetical protein
MGWQLGASLHHFVARHGGIIMNTRLLGIALIILGVVAFAYQGITYTTQEKVLDIGPIKATVEKEKTIPLPPLVGGAALIGGIVLLLVGARKP